MPCDSAALNSLVPQQPCLTWRAGQPSLHIPYEDTSQLPNSSIDAITRQLSNFKSPLKSASLVLTAATDASMAELVNKMPDVVSELALTVPRDTFLPQHAKSMLATARRRSEWSIGCCSQTAPDLPSNTSANIAHSFWPYSREVNTNALTVYALADERPLTNPSDAVYAVINVLQEADVEAARDRQLQRMALAMLRDDRFTSGPFPFEGPDAMRNDAPVALSDLFADARRVKEELGLMTSRPPSPVSMFSNDCTCTIRPPACGRDGGTRSGESEILGRIRPIVSQATSAGAITQRDFGKVQKVRINGMSAGDTTYNERDADALGSLVLRCHPAVNFVLDHPSLPGSAVSVPGYVARLAATDKVSLLQEMGLTEWPSSVVQTEASVSGSSVQPSFVMTD